MMEADKILHLKRYITLLRNVGVKSHITHYLRPLHDMPESFGKGYVSSYVCRHVPQTHLRNYAASIKMQYSTIAQSPIENIDDKLTSFYDSLKSGKLSAENLKEVIKLCNDVDYQLHRNTGILLLKCCGDLLAVPDMADRQHLTNQVWHLLQTKHKDLDLEHYNTLLNVHAENGTPVEPMEFLAGMTVEPDETTYCLLLNTLSKIGNGRHLRDILSIIKEKNISLSEDTLNALVKACAANGNIVDAEFVVTFMRNAKFPVAKAYSELVCGYARTGDIPNLVKILNDEPQSDATLLRIIEALSSSGNGRHIPVILNFLMALPQRNESEISKAIVEFVRKGQVGDAYTIVHCFALNSNMDDIPRNLINTFLNELIMTNTSIEDITKYASEFVESGSEPQALVNIAEVGLKLGRESLCLAMFQTMNERNIEVRPHYYWPLLITAQRNDGESKIFSLIENMVDTNVEIDSDTLVNYIFPYVNTVEPILVWRRLLIHNISRHVVYTPFVYFLLSQNRTQDAVSFCKYVSSQFNYRDVMKPLVRSYVNTRDVKNCITLLTMFSNGHKYVGIFLMSLLNDKRFNSYIEDIKFLLEAFKECGVKISQRDGDIIKGKITNIYSNSANLSKIIDSLVDDNLESSSILKIPNSEDMNTEELACYLEELKSKNMNTRAVLRKLLQAYCKENKLKKAEKIKQELDANEFQWTPGMKISLFDLYLKHDKLTEAEALLSDIRSTSSNFKIDNIKLVTFATMLVKAGKVEEAFKIIEECKEINTRQSIQKYSCTLLYAMAHSQYHKYTRDMFHLLVNKKYCTVSTELLRPLVAIPLERNDILSAIDTFAECARKYKKIPLAKELLTTLLEQREQQISPNTNKYIQEVYNIIVDINGTDVATTYLVIGLATLNKTEELRDILKKREISTSTLMHYFNHAQRNDNGDSLLRIFEATSNTNNLHQIILCNMLLFVYSKTGNCNAALTLWRKMCSKNVLPSEQFKNNFTQLLLSNKLPLPPELEVDKNKINNSD